jgi:hypothetical protein
MLKPRKWTLDKIVEEASKYDSLKDFRIGSESAYKAYINQGKPLEVLSIFPDTRTYWTTDSAKEEALKYNSRWDFQCGSAGAYRFLWKLGELDSIFEEYSTNSWDKTSIELYAKLCSSRTEFKYNFPGAHKAAYQRGMLEGLFGETYNTPKCDYDVVYIWKPVGFTDVYKIGITSKRLGDRRIKYVCLKSGLDCDWCKFVYTPDAKEIETHLLNSFDHYVFQDSFSGSTEFRYIPDIEEVIKSIEGVNNDTN